MRSRAEVVEQPALFGCLRSEADEVSLERGNDEPVLEEYHPSWRSERGLDWFAFFLADIQTGWGPFVAAYLTSKAWTQLDIGLILTVGTLSAMVLQVPFGALVDLIPGQRSTLRSGGRRRGPNPNTAMPSLTTARCWWIQVPTRSSR